MKYHVAEIIDFVVLLRSHAPVPLRPFHGRYGPCGVHLYDKFKMAKGHFKTNKLYTSYVHIAHRFMTYLVTRYKQLNTCVSWFSLYLIHVLWIIFSRSI